MRKYVLTAVLTVIACSPTVRVTRLSAERYPARPADYPIRIYSAERPRCPYEEVGIISSRQRNKFVSMEKVAEAIREKTRELGGDAVVGLSESDQIQGAGAAGTSVFLDRDPVLSGTAIRFKDVNCKE